MPGDSFAVAGNQLFLVNIVIYYDYNIYIYFIYI